MSSNTTLSHDDIGRIIARNLNAVTNCDLNGIRRMIEEACTIQRERDAAAVLKLGTDEWHDSTLFASDYQTGYSDGIVDTAQNAYFEIVGTNIDIPSLPEELYAAS